MASIVEQDSSSAPPPPQRKRDYRSGFMFGGIGFLAATALGVVSMIITSRVYGVRVIGEFALVSAPVSALWMLSTIREQQALIKELSGLPARDPRVTQLFAAVFTFSWALTGAMALLAIAACWLVFRGPLHVPELVAPAIVNIVGYAAITNTGWNVDSIFQAFVAGREIFWVRLHELVSFILIALAVGLAWRSVWGLVLATVGGSATALAHRLMAARPFVRARIDRDEYREGLRVLPQLLRFGLKVTPGQIAQGVSQQSGVWALGTVASVSLLGAYSRAQLIPQRLQQASMRISEVLYPTLVGRHIEGDRDGFDRALVDSIRYEMIGMLMIAAAIGGSARAVLAVFGPGFSRASSALALLAVFPALAAVTVTQTQALWATDRPGRSSLHAVARLLVTLALLIILTPRIGIAGPAVALLSGYVVVIVLNGIALRTSLARPLRATWPLRERIALIGAYAAGFAAANFMEHAVGGPLWMLLPLSLAGGGLAYLSLFVLVGGVNDRDRERTRDGLGALRRWRHGRSKRPRTAVTY